MTFPWYSKKRAAIAVATALTATFLFTQLIPLRREIQSTVSHSNKLRLQDGHEEPRKGKVVSGTSRILREHEEEEVKFDPKLDFRSNVDREGFLAERNCSHNEDFQVRHAVVEMLVPDLHPSVLKLNQMAAEEAFAEVYNSITGTCSDVYKRMIHQVSLASASVVAPLQHGEASATKITWNVLVTCDGCGHGNNPLFSSLLIASPQSVHGGTHHSTSQGNLRKNFQSQIELVSRDGTRVFIQEYLSHVQALLPHDDSEATQNDSSSTESKESSTKATPENNLDSLDGVDTDTPSQATSLATLSPEGPSPSSSFAPEEIVSTSSSSDFASSLMTPSTMIPSTSATDTQEATAQNPTDSVTDDPTMLGERSRMFRGAGASSLGYPSEASDLFPNIEAISQPSWNITETSTELPSAAPSDFPSHFPSHSPSSSPSSSPSLAPSLSPSLSPSATPSVTPSVTPSLDPSGHPSMAPSLDDDVVQVYVLLGQSNMFGKGRVGSVGGITRDGTLQHAVKQKGLYPYLLDSNGDWATSSNVRNVGVIDTIGGGFKVTRNEFMAIHDGDIIGPEIGIGHFLEQQKQAQGTTEGSRPILMLKSCIGNRSLGWDLRPPGTERYVFNDMVYAAYGDSPASWPEGQPKPPAPPNNPWYAGKQYDSDLAHVKDVLADIGTYYPGATRYKVAGFFWWQGDKDTKTEAYGIKYERNLVQLISQLRIDLEAPDAKFVLATLGQTAIDDMESSTEIEQRILKGMLAVDGTVGKYPQYAGNVATVYSYPLSKGGSSSGHYGNNAETYMNVGLAMGQAMIDLQSDSRDQHQQQP